MENRMPPEEGQISLQRVQATSLFLARGALRNAAAGECTLMLFTLGPWHQSTRGSMNNLAGLPRQQGKLAEAEPLYREALEASRATGSASAALARRCGLEAGGRR